MKISESITTYLTSNNKTVSWLAEKIDVGESHLKLWIDTNIWERSILNRIMKLNIKL